MIEAKKGNPLTWEPYVKNSTIINMSTNNPINENPNPNMLAILSGKTLNPVIILMA